jgi:hypothetical protein
MSFLFQPVVAESRSAMGETATLVIRKECWSTMRQVALAISCSYYNNFSVETGLLEYELLKCILCCCCCKKFSVFCFGCPLGCNNFFYSGCSCNYSATKFATNSSIKSLIIRKHNQSDLIPFALGVVKFLHPLTDQDPLILTS